jgi:glycoside/pentoside/hexuronide:cation symporter, GPH family
VSNPVPMPPPLGFPLKLTYGVGSVAYGVAAGALSATVLVFYFNQVLHIPAVWAGAAILVSLIADVMLDLLIGYWSDNIRSPLGRRHPFMYAAAVPVAFFFYFLWHAPRSLDGPAALAFAIAMLIGVRVSVAAYEIPSIALTPELAPDYHQRTSLLAYRWFFAMAAIGVIQLLLYTVYLRQDASNPLGARNPERYAEFGAMAAIVMFVCILASSAATHSRIRFLHQAPRRGANLAKTFKEIASVFSNPALLVVMASSLLGGAGVGITTSLQTYFYLHLWGLLPQTIGPLSLGALLASVTGVFLAPAISKRFGKKRAMIVLLSISVFTSILPVSARLLGLMPPNGSALLLALLFLDVFVTLTLGLMGLVLVTSMVADVVEDQQVKSGVRSEGVLFAANGLVPKVTLGIGAFIAGILLTVVRFPTYPGAVIDPAIMRHLALAWIPCVVALNGGSVAALLFYRIDRETHERNVESLRAAAALAETSQLAPDISGAVERLG